MKKILSLGLTLALFAGGMTLGSAPFVSATAETEDIIQPMALYEFEDETKPGQDTSGNGFDLKVLNTSQNGDEAIQIKEDTDGEKYVSLVSDRNAEDKGGKTGACLYAPQLGNSGMDFSDLIRESYTVSITFRRDNSKYQGDHYMLAVGRYNDAFQITPWKNGVEIQVNNMDMAPGANNDEKQQWLEKNLAFYTVDTSNWTTVTVSTDAVKNAATIYINGEAAGDPIQLSDTFFSWRSDPYAFTLGAQCQITGNAATCYATADIKECRVYDSALSETNVKRLVEGEEAIAEESGTYITSVTSVDTAALDLLATDVNTVDVIMNETLPKTTKATLSNGTEINVNILWYMVSETEINGFISTPYAKTEQLILEAEYGYTVRFDYDETLVRVSQIKLDGNAYTPGTPIDSELHNLTFKVTVLDKYSAIDAVSYLDMEWPPENEAGDEYYIELAGGAEVIIEASAEEFTVTYYDGNSKLGTSKYTHNGDETLKSFDKEGYTFDGWYTDAALTKPFAALDYANPVDISLYAKYTKTDGGSSSSDSAGGETSDNSGCGSVEGISAGFVILAAGAAIALKKKK